MAQRKKSWPKGTLPKSEPEMSAVIDDVPRERLQAVLRAELMRRYEVVIGPSSPGAAGQGPGSAARGR